MDTAFIKDTIEPLANKGYWPAVAAVHFDNGAFSKAVELCRRMLDREPHVISGRVILARSMYHAGHYDLAREQFLEVLKRDANHIVALKYLGDILYREKEEAGAMAYYRRVMEIDPNCGGLSCPVDRTEPEGTKQLTLKRPEEKSSGKERVPLREPAFITETIGDIYRSQGYYHMAEEVYRRLLVDRDNNRIAEKLRETEEKIGKRNT